METKTQLQTTPKSLVFPREQIAKIYQLYSQLSNVVLYPPNSWGANEFVLGGFLTLLSGYPGVFIGPPGTAKTTLVEVLAAAMNVRYAYRLLSKFTQPEELFGAIDLESYKSKGIYRRVHGAIDGHPLTILDADIVMLDEIFKASSAILNTLLDIILFKRYVNGDKVEKIEWLALYAASNEVPTESELAALYDRFVIRIFVEAPQVDIVALWKASDELERMRTQPSVKLDKSDVLAVRQYIQYLASMLPGNVLDKQTINRVIEELRSQGITISLRRLSQWPFVAAALAVFYGQQSVSIVDLLDSLIFIAPQSQEEAVSVREVTERFVAETPEVQVLNALISDLEAVRNNLAELPPAVVEEHINQAEKKLNEIKARLSNRRSKATALRVVSLIKEVRARLPA